MQAAWSLSTALRPDDVKAMRHDQNVDKHNVPVRVQFPDGSVKNGLIFLRQGQRTTDMLIEEKLFFPMRTITGTVLINKNNVALVELLDRKAFENQRELFPPFDWKGLEQRSW
jgi:hypothetical protein